MVWMGTGEMGWLNAFVATDPRIWKSGDRVRKKKESHINWTPTLSLPCALHKFYFMPMLMIIPFTDEETGIGTPRFF